MVNTEITYAGTRLELVGHYTAAEPAVRYSANGGHPGSSAAFTVVQVLVLPERTDITGVLEELSVLDAFDQLALAAYEG